MRHVKIIECVSRLAYCFVESVHSKFDVPNTMLEAFLPCVLTDDIPSAQPVGITVPCGFL